MIRATVCALLAGALLLTVPGGSSHADTGVTVIKVATMAPRTKRTVLRSKKFNAKLKEATQGRVEFRTYYGGVMGDDHTVLRKIKSGQIDASAFGSSMVANFVRQAAVLNAPRTFTNYKQVDAVRRELSPDFNEEAFRNGFKVLSWWDFGKVRMFSKSPVRTISDLTKMRPWLYPHSPLLRQFYKNNGVTGVPLGIREVYGALQVGMIDTVWASAVVAMALRWNTKIKYMSEPLGIIQGAFVLSRKTWDKLSPEDQVPLMKMIADNRVEFQAEIRKADGDSYRRMLKRGLRLVKFKNTKEWQASGMKLRKQMIGRVYNKALLDRVEAIAAKYKDPNSDIL